jgi:TP901 family phage tail tape measure protein
MATIGRLVVQIGADVGGLTAGLQTAQGKLKGFGSQMKSIGTGLSLGLSAPIIGVAGAALNSAADFESSMNLMQASSGATGAQMDALQAQALSLGATTSFSAGEAAAAMLELSKAGMSAEQVSAAIPGVMDLAAAGGINLADAATITSNAINSFGLNAAEATGVANSFAAAANASSADVGDLAQGFQMAGAVFASNGQTVDDLNTSLAILSNNGIAGSDAGTSLKTMMMRLAAPTDKAAGVVGDLGLEVYDASGAMLPFMEIVAQLGEATRDMSDDQRNAALQTMFGADAIRAATILAREGSTAYEDMKDAVMKEGAASEMAGARMKGLGGAIEYFKGSVDSLLIGAALPFLDTLGGMVRKAADLLTSFTTLSPSVQRFAAILLATLAVTGPLLLLLGGMATALAALMSPIGLAIAGLLLLGVVVAANWGRISSVVESGLRKVQPAVDAIVGTINGLRSGDLTFSEVGAGLVAELKTLPEKIQAWADSVDWAGLVGQAGDVAGQIYGKVAGWFAEIDWAGMFSSAVGSASSLAAAFGGWMAAIDWAGAAAQAEAGLITLRDTIMGKVAAIDWAGAAAQAESGLLVLRDMVMAQVGAIDWAGGIAQTEEGLTTLRNNVMEKVGAIDWQAGVENAGAFLSALDTWRDGLMAQVTERVSDFDWTAVAATFTGWIDGLSATVSSLDLSGIDWAEFLNGKLLGPFSMALTGVEFVVGPDNFQTLKTGVTNGIAAIDWAGVADSMWELASAVGGQVFNTAIDLVGDVSQKINDIDWGALTANFAGMVSWVAGKISGIDWAGAGFDIGNALINLAGAVGGAIREMDWGAMFSSGAELLGSTGQAGLDIGGGLLDAVTEKITAIDWAAASLDFSTMVAGMTTKIQETDWSSLGQGVGEKLRTMFENTFSGEGDNPISRLGEAVRTALTEIDWSNIGDSLSNFGSAAAEAIQTFVDGVFAGLGVDMSALTWPAFPEWPDWKEWNDWLDWNAWNVWESWNAWNDWKPWNPFPDWEWPSLPTWSWPSIPRPSWWHWGGEDENTDNSGGSGGFNAVGTPSWRGGPTWVGEFGPELVSLPKGARIWSHSDSMAMAAAAGGGNVTVGPNYITDNVDVEALAYRVAVINARRKRG